MKPRKYQASDLLKDRILKLTINIEDMKFLEWRMKIGIQIIKLAIKIIGMKSEIEVKPYEL